MTGTLSLQQEARIAGYRTGPLPPSTLLYRFPGAVDAARLLEATALVGAGTDAWCHRFDAVEGRAWPVGGDGAVHPVDLGAVDGPAAVQDALDTPFDVAAGPLARAVTGRLPCGARLFGLAVDHLVWDNVSTHLTTRRVAAVYGRLGGQPGGQRGGGAAAVAGEADAVGTEVPYSAFVRRQREAFAGEWGERVRAWWLARMEEYGEFPPVIAGLPRPERAAEVPRDVAVHRHLPATALARVLERSRRLRVSRYALLLAAVLRALRRVADPQLAGVLVDAPSRPWPEFAGTVGFFSHALPVWDHPAEDDSLDATARRVHAWTGPALAHAVPLRPLLWSVGRDRRAGGVWPVVTFEDESTVPVPAFAGLGGVLEPRPEVTERLEPTGDAVVFWLRSLGDGLLLRMQSRAQHFDEHEAGAVLDALSAELAP